MNLRSKVARLIDPAAFRKCAPSSVLWANRRKRALETADAILALVNRRPDTPALTDTNRWSVNR